MLTFKTENRTYTLPGRDVEHCSSSTCELNGYFKPEDLLFKLLITLEERYPDIDVDSIADKIWETFIENYDGSIDHLAEAIMVTAVEVGEFYGSECEA